MYEIADDRRTKEEKERHNEETSLRQKKHYFTRSSSISRSKSSHNSLSRSRYEFSGKEYQQIRSRSGSRNRKNLIKRRERLNSSNKKSPRNSKKIENDLIIDKNSGEEVKMKRFNFLMCLPKNYYRFIEKDYESLFRDVKKFI